MLPNMRSALAMAAETVGHTRVKRGLKLSVFAEIIGAPLMPVAC